MYRKTFFRVSFVLVLVLAGNVLAYDIMMWDNDEGNGDRLWDNASNWMPLKLPKVPEDNDWCAIDEYYGDPCNGPIINADMDAVCRWIDFGYYTSGADVILTMEGGSLTIGLWLSMGYYQGGYYRLDISGGTIDVNYVYVGVDNTSGTYTINMSGGTFNTPGYQKGLTPWDFGYLAIGTGVLCPQADMNMTGGYADVGWLQIGSWDTRTGKGHVDLHGGTIEADILGMGGGGEGTMDFAGGTLIINGDYRVPNGWLFDPCSDTPLEWGEDGDYPGDYPIAFPVARVDWDGYTGTIPIFAKRGLITAYGAKVGEIITDSNYPSVVGLRAAINLDYDGTNPGQTTITGGAFDPNLAWDPDPLHFSGGYLKGDVNLSWVAGDNAASHEVYLGTSFDDVNDANNSLPVGTSVYKGNQPLADVNYPVFVTWNATYYWRIDEVNAATTWKGTVWNFVTIPVWWATNPRPTGAGASPTSTILRWDPGPEAADVNGHHVYFSTDFNDVNDRDPNVLTVRDTNNYAPGALELNTRYYWAVDEVNNLEDPNVWPSPVWDFKTADYLSVDDFDSYADAIALMAVWVTGHLTNNGAELSLETVPDYVRDGKSMIYAYRNVKAGGQYVGSEAEADIADLEVGADWTAGEALVLYFYGDAGNGQEIADGYHITNDQMYVAVEDGSANVGIVKLPDMNAIKEAFWHEWNVDLQDPCLADVNMVNIAKVYIGFGGQKTGQSEAGAGEKSGKFDTVWFDDIRLYEFNNQPVACIVGGDRAVEAGSGCEARVILDGSCSSDLDSTLGTNDDIVYFDWYEQIDPCDPNSDIFLGSGEIIECNLPLGEHTIILEVTDRACAFDTNEVTIIVEDTTPPVLTCPDDIAVSGGFGGAEVTYDPTATDECDANPAVTTDIASGSFFETGVTTVTATATDSSGNSSMCTFDVIVSCFGINEVKIKTEAGKKGDDIKIKGTFNPGVPIDLMIDDVIYTIDDGPGHVFSFLIPAGSFELEGKGDKDKYKFHSPKGSVPDIKAKFDFDKCKFEFKAKKVAGIDEITSTSLEIILQAGANIAREIVELEVKGKKGEHLEYKRKPKFECCPEM